MVSDRAAADQVRPEPDRVRAQAGAPGPDRVCGGGPAQGQVEHIHQEGVLQADGHVHSLLQPGHHSLHHQTPGARGGV